jgi:arylformamidase
VAARDIRLVGIDGPGIGPFGEESTPVHLALLAEGVIALEGLNLAGVTPGAYELICLPLLIEGGDGAPARVLLIRNS